MPVYRKGQCIAKLSFAYFIWLFLYTCIFVVVENATIPPPVFIIWFISWHPLLLNFPINFSPIYPCCSMKEPLSCLHLLGMPSWVLQLSSDLVFWGRIRSPWNFLFHDHEYAWNEVKKSQRTLVLSSEPWHDKSSLKASVTVIRKWIHLSIETPSYTVPSFSEFWPKSLHSLLCQKSQCDTSMVCVKQFSCESTE